MNASNQQPNPLKEKSSDKKLRLIDKARDVIRGDQNFNSTQLKELYLELEHYNQFAYATEVLLRKMRMDEENGQPLTLKEYQKLAMYIYKDHSLPSAFKFKRAFQELNTHDDLSKTKNCDTLGMAGAIYKRRWQFDHQFKNLILSRYYYLLGYSLWKEFLNGTAGVSSFQNDDGYTAINYAYINELMAVDKLEEHGDVTGMSESINQRLGEADKVRSFILTTFIKYNNKNEPELTVSNPQNWVLATVAEAFFGIRKYKEAALFIESYLSREGVQDWEKQTFNQQILSISYLQLSCLRFYNKHKAETNFSGTSLEKIAQEIKNEEIQECLKVFSNKEDDCEEKNPGEKNQRTGRFGLALSGGGFRASLFHIGVLAALAEKDELRNVEVLSCVSGGSIIGAYYYIKLKQLLESKNDCEIKKDDYIKIVKEIEADFLTGVQKNLRVRIFTNLVCNLKMLFSKNYSRTHRVGELYQEHLYKKLYPGRDNIFMSDLFIFPKDAPNNFDVNRDNWKRRNKIPQLVLNATSVNTGHNWQFTASWMGEPPGNIQPDVDVKPRLRRMYYQEAPEEYKNFKLCYAVGASSCVPVMFHPMPMYGLYEGIDLQLVDGGLHDNQGIAALIEQECNNMFISDASGQLSTSKIAAANEAALFYRTDSILQERIRELQFMDIKERNYTATLSQLVTVHLKNDLQQNPVNWKHCIDPPRSIVYSTLCADENDLTNYGILRSVQLQLSALRTDLDSFSDTEAYALMYSGYMQTHHEWNKTCDESTKDYNEGNWNFYSIKEHMTRPQKAETIKNILAAGSKLFLKLPAISKTIKVLWKLLFVLTGLLAIWLIYRYRDCKLIDLTLGGLVTMIVVFFIGRISKILGFVFNSKGEVTKWLLLLGVMLLGFLLSGFYIILLNPLYNKIGKLKNK